MQNHRLGSGGVKKSAAGGQYLMRLPFLHVFEPRRCIRIAAENKRSLLEFYLFSTLVEEFELSDSHRRVFYECDPSFVVN